MQVREETLRYLDMSARMPISDPGVPNPKPTTAYWQSPPHRLASNRSARFPSSTTVVIIGSGITGTSVAHNLFEASPDIDVVMLEARTTTSGATGRNGGHCKDVPFKHYRAWKKAFGKEAAQRLVNFRGSHVEVMRHLAGKVREEGFTDAHFRDVESVTAVFDPTIFQELRTNLEEWLQDCAPEKRTSYSVTEGVDVEEKYGILSASGVLTSPAAALWPYRLVASLLERLLRHHRSFSLETLTPVLSITASGSSTQPYQVHTPRGSILTQHVIHCTNGHASHLLPKFQGKIVPVRGQMTALNPPSSFPRLGHIRSWSLYYANGGFDYMTQAAGEDGEVLLGGGVEQAAIQNVVDLDCTNDAENNSPALKHLCSVLPKFFCGGIGTKLKQAWTGTMGFTPDGFPVVGRIPRDLSQIETVDNAIGSEWIAAGFNGYGMVQSWQSGRAISEMVLGVSGDEKIDQYFPRAQFECSRERLESMHFDDLHAAFHKNVPVQGRGKI